MAYCKTFYRCFSFVFVSFCLLASAAIAHNEQDNSMIIISNGSVKINGNSSHNSIQGSGNVTTEQRDIPLFSAIQVSGGIDVLFSLSDKVGCSVKADDNLLPVIKTLVEGRTLKIFSDHSYITSSKIVVECASPNIVSASLSGSGDIDINDLVGANLSLSINGSGNILVSGKIQTFTAMVNGSGDVKASYLYTQNANLSVKGSGDIQVNCRDTLTASVFGSGDILVSGSPNIQNKNTVGSGSIAVR